METGLGWGRGGGIREKIRADRSDERKSKWLREMTVAWTRMKTTNVMNTNHIQGVFECWADRTC